MRRMFLALFALFAVAAAPFASADSEVVRFDAEDGTMITADWTKISPSAPTLVLFHMAGASRGEYREIALKLNELGYNTLAIDQRSGGQFNGVLNETRQQFTSNPGYADAIPDMKAATAYARAHTVERVGVIGSSYSAALVLKLAGEDPEFADAVIAFSPGEYFGKRGFVKNAAEKLEQPVFVTAARQETGQWQPIFDAIPSGKKTGFEPTGAGRHGATALLTDAGPEYWTALEAFLAKHLPVGGS